MRNPLRERPRAVHPSAVPGVGGRAHSNLTARTRPTGQSGPMSHMRDRHEQAAPSTHLHARFPGLDLGHVRLGSGPTPVREIGADLGLRAELWVKDDGAFGDGPWGGNKGRKLEWILPEAQRRGERVLFSVGGIGTHWGLALATYARRLGLETLLGLVDQPVDDHVREQLARLLTSGAEIHRFSSTARL